MPRFIKLDTPENVNIDYELAGIGSRGIAILIDGIIQISFCLILVLVLYGFSLLNFDRFTEWTIGLIIITLFVILYGYHFIFELIWNGQTPGKRFLGIRTIRDEGLPADAMAIAIRNVIRVIDSLPILYAVGAIFVFFSSNNKRIGDYAAGTVVVREIKRESIYKIEDKSEILASSIPLSAFLYDALEKFIERIPDLNNDAVEKISNDILQKISNETGEFPGPEENKIEFLKKIFHRSIRRK